MSEVDKARVIFRRVINEGRKVLTEYESKEVLRAYNIPTTKEKLAASPDEAAAFASEIGLPVVLKICSPDITHKTDVGGIKVGLKTLDDVKAGFDDIVNNAKRYKPDAKLSGVLVQNMVTPGHEIIVGVTKDQQFGPLLMFGLGGVLVEVIKDVSFRLPPITRKEALKMISEIKGYPILKGIRGVKPADIYAIASILEITSKMSMDLREIVEMDMNPVFVHEKGATVVDARIVLG